MRPRRADDAAMLAKEHGRDKSIDYRGGRAIQKMPRLIDGVRNSFTDWLSRITQIADATGEPIKRSFK